MTTNIGRDDADANYRYKMPVLTTKIEGRGNGIKTVITNMVDIAKALHIHPAYPTKFFGIELGAQSKINMSTERCIVNGSHMAADLSKILDRFIQQFILCPTCKLPELKMSIKSASVKIECAACGHASQIKSAHRLVGFMTKNPPKSFSEEATKEKKKSKKGGKDDDDDELDEESASVVAAAKAGGSSSAAAAADEADAGGEKKKKEKKDKKDKDETPEERAARKAKKAAKKEKKAAKKDETPEERAARKAKKAAKKEKKSDSESSDDEEEEKSTPAAAAASSSAPVAEKVKKVAADEDDEDGEDDESDDGDAGDDWHTDTSKAAVRKRQELEFAEMLAGAKKDVENIVISAKADNKADSPVTILKIFLASKTRQPSEIAAELRRLAMSRALDEPQKLKILLEAIIDINTPKTVVEQFKSKSALLKYFTTSSTGSNTATTLLTCIEDLIGVVERKLLPYAPMILKTLYEEDVLEEPTLLTWYDAPPEASWLVNKDVAAEVRVKAKPFIEWLRNAEEESDDE